MSDSVRFVILSVECRSDLRKGREWYDAQLPGLGSRFVRAFVEAVDVAAERPTSFPVIEGDVRRAILKKFPFGAFFYVEKDTIQVIAVIDLRSDDEKWRARLAGRRPDPSAQ